MKKELLQLVKRYFGQRGLKELTESEEEENYLLNGKIDLCDRIRNFRFYLPKEEENVTFSVTIELGWPMLFRDVKEVFNIVSDYTSEESLWDLVMSDTFGVLLTIDPMYKFTSENAYFVLDRMMEDLNKFKRSLDFQKMEPFLSTRTPDYALRRNND